MAQCSPLSDSVKATWDADSTIETLLARLSQTDVQSAQSDADVDAFNAREVENRKLVGAEAILDELDTAHRRLVEIARTLTEDELRERIPLSLVAWDTYLHYPDHAQDLGFAD